MIGHVERPVTSALAVVPKNEVSVPPVPGADRGGRRLSQALILAARSSTDPGSVPGGGVPALVPGPEVGFGGALRLTAVAGQRASSPRPWRCWRIRRRRAGGRPVRADPAALAA